MYEYKARIVDVYDGDTFTFEVDLGFSIAVTEKIRLAGINTPEVRGSSKVEVKMVSDYVRSIILGKEVIIQVFKKGKFGRYIAYVFFDNLTGIPCNLTEHLLQRNYGVEFMSGKIY
jgi:micrococcal nuclease